MTTDIERLHHTIETTGWGDRRKGRTTAAIHNLIGILETAPDAAEVIYPIPAYRWIHHIRPMIIELFREADLEIERWQHQSIFYVKIRNLRHRVRFVIFRENDFIGWNKIHPGHEALRGIDYYLVNDLGECFENAL